ncbi:expressed unknown protein [Seminavis robusta]|uniref:Uncharacterized protein n=1 Tax=Seminavis robusta TaxID=568900 RepID=A0A9N8HV23_9STRA|nr:expressed unknown protein [Seminavis robusta]|eukprot:Sro1854_g301840.1 n/a (235) ;mRNA; f:4127-4921
MDHQQSDRRTSWLQKKTWSNMSFKVSLEGNSSRRTSTFTMNSQPSQRRNRKEQVMRLITTQAALYSFSYLLTESSNIAVSIAYYTSDPVGSVPVWVLQYALITIPLQGFWNCLIYFRPRFLKWKEERAEKMDATRRTETGGDTQQFPAQNALGYAPASTVNSCPNVEEGKQEEAEFDETIDEETSTVLPNLCMEDFDEAEIHSQLAIELNNSKLASSEYMTTCKEQEEQPEQKS